MELMKKIIFGLSRSKSPWKIGSKVIQEVEKRDFSHVYVRYEDPYTKEMLVAQASHGYVNQVHFDTFQIENVIVEEYELEFTNEEFKELLIFIHKNLGKGYSKLQIVLIGIKKIFHIELNEYENRDKEFICSEFASRLLQIYKIPMPEHLDYVTPSDFKEIIINIPAAKRIK